MKKFKSTIVFILMFILCIGWTLPVQASSISQDGLEVILDTNKETYSNGEEIEITLDVINTNNYAVSNVSIENIVPKDYKLKDGKNTKELETLEAGEKVSLKIICLEEKVKETGKDEVTKPSTGNDHKATTVETGDGNNILFWGIILILSLTSVGLFCKKKKNRNRFFLFFLSVVMLGGVLMGDMTVNATEQSEKVINITENIKVENKEVTIAAIVKYSLPSNIEENYTITFESNGGSKVETQVIEKGSLVIEPKAPIKEGYNFCGWYIDKDLTKLYDFSQVVTSDMILYAKWEIIDEGESTPITRGEWINRLVTTMNYPAIESPTENKYFSDTDGSNVEDSINYAVGYDIIQLDDEKFYPNNFATREFVAVTTVKALGFIPEEDIVCDDVSEVENPKEAKIAVDLGIIDLINNNFQPKLNATISEANRAMKVVNEVLDSEVVSDEPIEEIVYRDGAIVFGENEVTIEDNKIEVNCENVDDKLESGKIIAIENYACYKIRTVERINEKYVITVEDAELQDALQSIHIEGKGTADFTQFIPEEGVEVEYLNSKEKARGENVSLDIFKFKAKINDDISLSGNIDEIELEVETKNEMNCSWPKVDCKNVMGKINFTGKSTGKIQVGLSDATDDEEIEDVKEAFENGKPCSQKITLGKVPIVGIPGMRIYISIGVEYDINGYFQLTASYKGFVGAQMYKNLPRLIGKMDAKLEESKIGGEISIGPRVSGVFKLLGFDMIDVATGMGPKAEGSMEIRDNRMICVDLSSHLYWYGSAFTNCKLGEWFNIGISKDFWNQENSIWKYNGHLENFELVDHCTYVDEKAAIFEGYVVDYKTAQPIDEAEILMIDSESGKVVKGVNTDEKGQFSIKVLGGKKYSVTVSKAGYEKYNIELNLNSNETQFVTIKMQPSASSGEVQNGLVLEAGKNYRITSPTGTYLAIDHSSDSIYDWVKYGGDGPCVANEKAQIEMRSTIDFNENSYLDISLKQGTLTLYSIEGPSISSPVVECVFDVEEIAGPVMRFWEVNTGESITFDATKNMAYRPLEHEIQGITSNNAEVIWNYYDTITQQEFSNSTTFPDDGNWPMENMNNEVIVTMTVTKGKVLFYLPNEDAEKVTVNR